MCISWTKKITYCGLQTILIDMNQRLPLFCCYHHLKHNRRQMVPRNLLHIVQMTLIVAECENRREESSLVNFRCKNLLDIWKNLVQRRRRKRRSSTTVLLSRGLCRRCRCSGSGVQDCLAPACFFVLLRLNWKPLVDWRLCTLVHVLLHQLD